MTSEVSNCLGGFLEFVNPSRHYKEHPWIYDYVWICPLNQIMFVWTNFIETPPVMRLQVTQLMVLSKKPTGLIKDIYFYGKQTDRQLGLKIIVKVIMKKVCFILQKKSTSYKYVKLILLFYWFLYLYFSQERK